MGGRATFSHRAFRDNRTARPPSTEHILERLSCDPASSALTLSRREMVALAGTMALASSAGLNAAASALSALDVTADRRSLRITAAGRTFILDAGRFGGAARFTVTRTASRITASLLSATYPGTDLCADMTLRFEPLDGSTRVHIRVPALRFSASVPLLAWLEGRKEARSRVSLDGWGSDLGDGYSIRFRGTAHAVFRPDLTVDLRGTDIVSLDAPGVSLAGHEAHVWLASASTPTTLTRRIRRRTFVQIRQKDASWRVDGVATPAGNSVEFDATSFDIATIEAAETHTGSRLAVLTFENAARAGSAGFRLPVGTGFETVASLLPLSNLRYGFVCGDGSRFSLVADVADTPTWLHLQGHSVLVRRHPQHEGIELTGAAGVADKVDVKTELLGVALPLEGVIASPLTFSSPSTESGADTVSARSVVGPERTFSPETAPSAAPPGYVADAGSLQLTRPDDMLTVKLEFYNLILKTDFPGPRLERKTATSPSYVTAELPSQALLEEAFFEDAESTSVAQRVTMAFDWVIAYLTSKTPPIKSRITSRTRLAFKVPDGILNQGGIPYTVDALLDWRLFENSVTPAGRWTSVTSGGTYKIPGVTVPQVTPTAPVQGSHYPLVAPETRIEAPWGIYLSPSPTREHWEHRSQPFTSNGVTELWHTNLTGETYADVSRGIPYPHKPKVRAVWARYYTTASNRSEVPTPVLFANSFSTHDSDNDVGGYLHRWALVDLTARYGKAPVTADRLTLSPLGAWLDLKGGWPDYPALAIASSLRAWEHRATMGRDQYVKIVQIGRLFPFGHAAVKITITERKFQTGPNGKKNAYLIQRQFIVVREPERTYTLADTGQAWIFRRFPYKRIRIKTLVTPDLKKPVDTHVSGATYSYWPTVLSTNERFVFEYEMEDWDGRVSHARSPLIWMDAMWAVRNANITNLGPGSPTFMEVVACADAFKAEVEIDLAGQKTAFTEAPPNAADGSAKDRRILETQALRLSAWNCVNATWAQSYGSLHFQPVLARAQVRLEDVDALMNSDTGTWIVLADLYTAYGYTGPNASGHVFAQIYDALAEYYGEPPTATMGLDIPPDRTGGFASPGIAVRGVSATQGAFGGDPSQFGADTISTASFFDKMNPTLFGGIRLLDILQGSLSLASGDVPNFNDYIVEHDGQRFFRYEYAWRTTKFGASDIFKHQSNPQTSLELYTQIEKSLDNIEAAPTSELKGTLSNFSLSFSVIEVIFNHFIFHVDTAGNVDVDPDIQDIQFTGALEFVNQLRQFLSYSNGGSGFAIDINGDGVSAIVTIALPDIAVGIFSLKNMAITAGLVIPFSGEPISFPFSFCTRDKPFELAVSGFGGGGYFLIELQASDQYPVKKIEFSLEFGICASVSLAGIASGSVEIKGGVLMIFEMGALTFTAFFRMAGRLDILGIIVIAVTFYLELTYMNKQAAGGPTEILIGEATLTLEIEILFFSFSVSLTVTKQFEGDDPKFGDWMNADEWATYCNAFGPATVGA